MMSRSSDSEREEFGTTKIRSGAAKDQVNGSGSMDFSGKVIIKAEFNDDIRLVPILNEDITFDELVLMMQRVFRGGLKSEDDIVLKYKDQDGDLVTIFDSSDLSFAISCCRVLKLKIILKDKEKGKKLAVPNYNVAEVRRELRQIRDRVVSLLDIIEAGASGLSITSVAGAPLNAENDKSVQIRSPKAAAELTTSAATAAVSGFRSTVSAQSTPDNLQQLDQTSTAHEHVDHHHGPPMLAHGQGPPGVTVTSRMGMPPMQQPPQQPQASVLPTPGPGVPPMHTVQPTSMAGAYSPVMSGYQPYQQMGNMALPNAPHQSVAPPTTAYQPQQVGQAPRPMGPPPSMMGPVTSAPRNMAPTSTYGSMPMASEQHTTMDSMRPAMMPYGPQMSGQAPMPHNPQMSGQAPMPHNPQMAGQAPMPHNPQMSGQAPMPHNPQMSGQAPMPHNPQMSGQAPMPPPVMGAGGQGSNPYARTIPGGGPGR